MDDVTDDDIVKLEIPTGAPIHYVFDSNGIKRKVTYAISSGLGSDNQNIVFDSTPVIDTVSEISEEEFTVDPQSLPMINNRVQGIISSIGANNTAASNYWNKITENRTDLTKVKNKSQFCEKNRNKFKLL